MVCRDKEIYPLTAKNLFQVTNIDGTPPAFWMGYWIHDASIDESTPSFIRQKNDTHFTSYLQRQWNKWFSNAGGVSSILAESI
jgi:hypothetical protein